MANKILVARGTKARLEEIKSTLAVNELVYSTDTGELGVKKANGNIEYFKNAADIDAIVTGKQDKLVAGTNITIENNTISATGDIGGTVDWQDVENKPELQEKLTAGANITINPVTNVISASGAGGGGEGIPEAPMTNMTYGRRNGSWEQITGRFIEVPNSSFTSMDDMLSALVYAYEVEDGANNGKGDFTVHSEFTVLGNRYIAYISSNYFKNKVVDGSYYFGQPFGSIYSVEDRTRFEFCSDGEYGFITVPDYYYRYNHVMEGLLETIVFETASFPALMVGLNFLYRFFEDLITLVLTNFVTSSTLEGDFEFIYAYQSVGYGLFEVFNFTRTVGSSLHISRAESLDFVNDPYLFYPLVLASNSIKINMSHFSQGVMDTVYMITFNALGSFYDDPMNPENEGSSIHGSYKAVKLL